MPLEIMNSFPTLTFYGAAGTVTGSKYLLQYDSRSILLEAGLFQGLKDLRLRNWNEPPFDPETIEAVVLSHAHIDHSGYLPILVRHGFHGKIYCSPGTEDLLTILLPDAAKLQEEEAAFANKHGFSKHKPALPLFTEDDARAVLRRLEAQPYGTDFSINSVMKGRFHRAGHILGAAIVEINIDSGSRPHKLVFSGDLGRCSRPILRDPDRISEADTLLIESTYGGHVHPAGSEEQIIRIIKEIHAKAGTLIIPAFAVGRAQEILWIIRDLEERGEIPVLPVVLDSPMADNASAIYARHPEDHDLKMTQLLDQDKSPLATRNFTIARNQTDSISLNKKRGPLIIVSASGMATGGRVLHHLEHRLPDPNNVLLLAGFQAKGTRGRLLEEGAENVKIHGKDVPVKARIERLEGLSAHADQSEILKWLSGFKKPPRNTYIVHGEPASAQALAKAVESSLRWKIRPAADGETVLLE